MATLTWRKAYGAIKDHTKVGLAQINSDRKDLDVAIVKATNHVECPPKERHLRKVLIATSAVRPRVDVSYCMHALARRLGKTRNWTVALKTLIVVHRILREGDPTFREELLNFTQRGRILQLSNFKDDSSPIAWDCSAWVRTYALFLEERLECFRVLKYDIEAERLPKPAQGQGQEKGYSRTRDLDCETLLEQLPALQQLLYRLIGCRPEGAALGNYVIQYALALVLKESFKVYCAINDGIINLVDKFFDMPRHEAIKALEIYRRAGQQAANLSDFYEVCKGLELARNFQFPVLKEPPQSFLATMDEYIREAPRAVSVPSQQLEFPEGLQLTYKPDDSLPEDEDSVDEEPQPVGLDDLTSTEPVEAAPAPPPANNVDSGDLLGLNDIAPDASAIEESNALALAIVPSDSTSTSNPGITSSKEFDPTGWELALVTTPSSNISSVTERQLAGGLDSLTLNSLYDEVAYRANQQPVYGTPAPNPFEVQDPFAMSNSVAPPAAVQITAMTQQRAFTPFGTYQASFQPQPHMGAGAPNPFTDTGFGPYPDAPVSQSQHANPFGSTGLL